VQFHMIDRIESWTPDERITAHKVTSRQEDYWQQGGHGQVMPFGLVLEAVCQAGTWLFLLSSDHRRRAALLTVDEAVRHREVRPGDVLRMRVEVVALSAEAAVLDGAAEVDGETVLTARGVMCALIEADRLDDPADTARMGRQLLGGGLGR
jgi:3-hydroxyacyl-[acyl-carrier-protein] dehydratase